MIITYIIRQTVGYRNVKFIAHDELEMAAIVKLLLKGEPEKGTDTYEVNVSVEYTVDEPEVGKPNEDDGSV